MFADVLALLKGISPYEVMHFSYNNRPFYCQNGAVTTVFKISQKTKGSCKNTADLFLKRNPLAKNYMIMKLHREQKYHLIPYAKNCFVKLNAGVTLSESMLEKGFAMLDLNMDKSFLDSSIYAKLLLAQERAKYHNRGLWEDNVLVNCFLNR